MPKIIKHLKLIKYVSLPGDSLLCVGQKNKIPRKYIDVCGCNMIKYFKKLKSYKCFCKVSQRKETQNK